MYKAAQFWWLPEPWRVETAWQQPDDCLTTAWCLSDNCLTTARRLPDNCLTTAWRLPDDYLRTYLQLPDNYLTTTWPLLDKSMHNLNMTAKSLKRWLLKIIQQDKKSWACEAACICAQPKNFKVIRQNMLGDIKKLLAFKCLWTMPSNVLLLYLKQTSHP